jgi:hypothetical protein
MRAFAIRLSAGALLIGLLVAPHAALSDSVVGTGTPASCTEAALNAALANASTGGNVTFDCGPTPVTITVTHPLSLYGFYRSIDGGNLITLSGGGTAQLFVISPDFGDSFSIANLRITDGASSAANGGAFSISSVHPPIHVEYHQLYF